MFDVVSLLLFTMQMTIIGAQFGHRVFSCQNLYFLSQSCSRINVALRWDLNFLRSNPVDFPLVQCVMFSSTHIWVYVASFLSYANELSRWFILFNCGNSLKLSICPYMLFTWAGWFRGWIGWHLSSSFKSLQGKFASIVVVLCTDMINGWSLGWKYCICKNAFRI